jgi:hypothetical protein
MSRGLTPRERPARRHAVVNVWTELVENFDELPESHERTGGLVTPASCEEILIAIGRRDACSLATVARLILLAVAGQAGGGTSYARAALAGRPATPTTSGDALDEAEGSTKLSFPLWL